MGPWEKYQQPSGQPQLVPIAPPDPFKVRDQQLQEEAARRAAEDQQFQREKHAAEMALKERELAQQGGKDVAAKQVETARALLTAAGVDLQRGIDPISDLIKGSTSGPIQKIGAQAYGAVTGDATSGMENIARLQTVVSDLTLQLTGGGLGNQISNADREFIMQRVGNLADPNVPADARLAAWQQVKQRMANILGVQGSAPQTDEDFRRGIEERVKRGENPASIIKWLVDNGRAPDEQTIAAIIANQGNQRPDVRPPDGSPVGHAFGVGVRGVVEGAGDVLGIVSDPFIQGVNAVTGSNLTPDFGDNLADMLGLPEPQNDAERLAFEASRLGTGALGIGGAAGQVARYIPGAVGQAAQQLGNMPLTDAFSGFAGGASGEVARQQGAGPVGQAAATFAGGALALPIAARTASSRAVEALNGGPNVPPPPVVRAGQEEGVGVNRAMADPSVQPKVVARGKTMLGSRVMARENEKIAGQIERRVGELGQGGTALDQFTGGEAVQNIGRRYIKASGKQFSAQYDRLRKATEGVNVQPTQAAARIDEILSRLSATPETNAAEIRYLQSLKSDLSRGLSVDTARDIGSKLSADIRKGAVTFGKAERDVLDIRQAIAEDVANGLAAAGKQGVAAQFRQVDAAYRERMDFIQNTLQKVLGSRDRPLPPEQAFARIMSLASPRGDSTGFRKILAQATPQERADIAATFAETLGKNRKGDFSTAILANNIEAMPERVRVMIFGKDGAKSLENLSRLAKEHARVTQALGGSPTALATDARSWVLNLLFGGGVGLQQGAVEGVAVGAGLAAAKAGRDVISARALMSPKITGWLRSIPRTQDPKAINAAWARLASIATREPALAPEVQQIQEAIVRALNDNVAPGAAAGSLGDDQQGR